MIIYPKARPYFKGDLGSPRRSMIRTESYTWGLGYPSRPASLGPRVRVLGFKIQDLKVLGCLGFGILRFRSRLNSHMMPVDRHQRIKSQGKPSAANLNARSNKA